MFINKNINFTVWKTVPKPKANIIFNHGLGESSQDYSDYLGSVFNSANYNILLYDVRGHGKSIGNKGDISNFHVWIDDLKTIINFVRKKNNLKIFLIGHSMGGIITQNYVVKYGDVDGVVISSAPVFIPSHLNKYLKYPLYLFNFKKKKLNFNSFKIVNSFVRYPKNPYRLEYVTSRLLRNLLFLSLRYLKQKLYLYKVPVLFLYGLEDQIVSYRNGIYLFNNVLSKDKKIKIYNKTYHNLFHDIESEKILNNIIEWLDKRIS